MIQQDKIEEEIKSILKDAKLISQPVNNGYDKEGFPITNYLVYWDPYNNDWRNKEQALVGYVLKKLKPTIEKVIKDADKV